MFSELSHQLSRKWWLVVLRGVMAILFGIVALVWPGLTLTTLVVVFGAFAMVDGILAMAHAISTRKQDDQWGAVALAGALGIVFGLLTFFWPRMTELVLLVLIATWAIVTGTLEVVAGIELRHAIEGEWRLILSGDLSVLFGVMLVAFPGAGLLSITWIIGLYAILYGIVLIAFAFRLRGLVKHAEKSVEELTGAHA